MLGMECGYGEDQDYGNVLAAAYGSSTVVWSPDGSQLVFDYRGRIYVLESDGSRLRSTYSLQDTDIDPEEYVNDNLESGPSISPDGSRLAFNTYRHVYGGFWDSFRGRKRSEEIGTSALYGSEYRRLTDHSGGDDSPTWSPDGKRIAFRSRRIAEGDSQIWPYPLIYTMAADGSDIRRVTPDSLTKATSYSPVWSPDSRRIAFVGLERAPIAEGGKAKSAVFTISADGADLRQIGLATVPPRLWHPVPPAWSRDGTRIVFADTEGEWSPKLYTANADGSDLYELPPLRIAGNDVNEDRAVRFSWRYTLLWSPDGSEIFLSGVVASGENTVKPGLFAATTDGSRVRLVTYLPSGQRATMSPDFSRIAVLRESEYGPQLELSTMAADGSDLRLLVRSEDGVLVLAE